MSRSDEVVGRLRAQSNLVSDMRAEAKALARDEVFRDVDRRRLRVQDDLARDLLRRLEEQADVSEVALGYAARIRSERVDGLQQEVVAIAALDDALHDIEMSNHHAAQAVARDEAGRSAEIEVLRLLQEANLIGFGQP